jgi:PAS domain S-box-containing protein
MANQTPPDGANEPINDPDTERAHKIREQRDRLGVTLFSIGDAVIATDALGQITLLNPVAESLTGWAEHDARGLPIESVFHVVNEVTREPVSQPVKKVIEFGVIQNLPQHTILITKDGLEVSIDDSAAPILGERGNLNGVALVFRDITERRRLEKGLEETRRHSEVIVAAVRDPWLVLDGELRVKSANCSFYTTFRMSPDDTIGRSFFELGDGQWNIPRLRVILEEILAQNSSFDDFEIDQDVPALGPRTMLLHARKVPGEGEWGKMILLHIEDVTGRRRITHALEASEIRFRRLFETAKDGILILDPDTGAIIDANPFLLELLGYSHADLLGKHFWEIGLLGDIDASRASFRELQEKGYVRYENLPLETREGGTSRWSSSATSIASTTS